MITLSPKEHDVIITAMMKPWVMGANGDDAYDCWGLCVHIYKELFDIELPDLERPNNSLLSVVKVFKHTELRKHLHQIPSPVHGCLVEMSNNVNPHHIGVYLDVDGGKVLHTNQDMGAAFQSIASLRSTGYKGIVYYEWK